MATGPVVILFQVRFTAAVLFAFELVPRHLSSSGLRRTGTLGPVGAVIGVVVGAGRVRGVV